MKDLKTLFEVERDAILEALIFFEGNRTYAAKALGISVRKLRYKLKEFARQGLQFPLPSRVPGSLRNKKYKWIAKLIG